LSLFWQNLIVLGIVLSAGVYLGRAVQRTLARRKATACGGCAHCPETRRPGTQHDAIQHNDMHHDDMHHCDTAGRSQAAGGRMALPLVELQAGPHRDR
jgi:hypothetical protein